MQDFERRAFAVDRLHLETRAEGEARHIVGHAAVFNTETDIGGWFREKIAPGAFARAIAQDDVRALFNHDANYVLGRNKAGTLTLSEDDKGLAIDIVPPDTSFARDLLVSLERGDVSQMSFGFRVLKELWDDTGDTAVRTLVEVELFDVSPVTYPAYPTTDAAVRSFEAYKKSRVWAPDGARIERQHRLLRARLPL